MKFLCRQQPVPTPNRFRSFNHMQNRTIDIQALYQYSWSQFKKYASFIIGIMVTYYILAVVPRIYFLLTAPEEPTMQSQLISLLLTFIQLFLGLGFTKIMLLLLDDNYAQVSDLLSGFRMFMSYFVGSFLYSIGIFVGLFLLVIPGIFVAIRFQFYPYYIIEHGDTGITALHKSYRETENLTVDLFLFGITVLLLNVMGALLLGVGIIITYPITTLATAIIYKGLLEQRDHFPGDQYINT